MEIKAVTTIGGGSGHYVLLSALRDHEGVNVTAVVSMTDSGGSTGRLRDELGVLPPGDILKCMIALSPHRETARKIFQMRFNGGSRLDGHNAGNLLLSSFSQYAGNFPAGVEAFSQMLEIKGRVFPVTIARATLVAVLDNGERIYGESAIDQPRGQNRDKIKEVFLVPHHSAVTEVYPPVLESIAASDFIIIGPGDLFTSIMPNLMVPGVAEALAKTSAIIIYVGNIMTKFGETDGYELSDFVERVEKCIGRPLDYVVANNHQPDKTALERYAEESAHFVEPNLKDLIFTRIIKADLLDEHGAVLRHSDEKLSAVLAGIFQAP